MNIGLIIALVAILLVLILGYNIMLQFKVKAESARKQESSRFLQVIDAIRWGLKDFAFEVSPQEEITRG